MKRWKKIGIGVGIIVLTLVGLLGYAMVDILTPTPGEAIHPYESPQKAILVIDVQEDYTGRTARRPYPDSARLIATLNTVLTKAPEASVIPVYIRQEFEGVLGTLYSIVLGGGTAFKGTPGAQIDARVAMLSDTVFTKPKGDAFSNPNLERFLRERHVNELYITGLDGIFCVDKTVKGALNRGYKVTIIADAVVTYFPKQWRELEQEYKQAGVRMISSQEFPNTFQ